MRSVRGIQDYPAGRPLAADDLVEFHASRLLLLVHLCGKKNRISGLTKLAKLDFFVRYPAFFERAASELGEVTSQLPNRVESAMVRHHYGPWDKRYYHVLAVLEGKGLLEVKHAGPRTYVFQLTQKGIEVADSLAANAQFTELVRIITEVGRVFRNTSGSALKGFIYRAFDSEVAKRRLGETITV